MQPFPQPESGNVNVKVDSIKSETDHKISKDNITQDKRFKHLFRGIGKFPVKPVDLEINPEIDPFSDTTLQGASCHEG